MLKNAIITLTLSFVCFLSLRADTVDIYIGTGGRGAEGIYHTKLDRNKGTLSKPTLAVKAKWSGFLAKHPNKAIVYAVVSHEKKPAVTSYTIQNDNSLKLLNTSIISDGYGSHIAVHPSAKFLMTAQYGGGSVAVFPLNADGTIGKESQLIEHEGGSKVVAKRQDKPHPHWVGFSPDARFAFVPDLGTDQIVIYKTQGNRIEKHGTADSIPGGGPRHMRFSHDGKFVYLLNELSMSVTTYAYDHENGTLNMRSTSPTLERATIESEIFNSASEILVHPNGKFIYSGNRGNDSISVFQANRMTGKLKRIEIEPIRGSCPRNINMDPSGKWMIAGGEHSHTLSLFKIDQETGELQFQMHKMVSVPRPMCILFVE